MSKHRHIVKVTTAVIKGNTPRESTPPKSGDSSSGRRADRERVMDSGAWVTPRGKPSSVVTTIPMSMAPFTFQAISTPVISRPRMARKVAGAPISPSSSAPSSALTMPEFSSPMSAMNSPRPALIAFFILGGIQETICSRRGVRLITR